MNATVIESDYQRLRSLAQVAEYRGLNRRALFRILQQAGISGATELRRRYRISLAVDRILGESTPAIAQRCGVHRSRVHRWLRELHPQFFKLINRGIFAATAQAARRYRNIPAKLAELRRWLTGNLLELLNREAQATQRPTLTAGAEQWLTRKETQFEGDFRDADIDARRFAREGCLPRDAYHYAHRLERAG